MRLRRAAMLCCFKLCPAILLNQRRDFVPQLLAQPQIGILLGWVCDGVPASGVAVNFRFGHLMPLMMKRMGDITKADRRGVGLFTQQLY